MGAASAFGNLQGAASGGLIDGCARLLLRRGGLWWISLDDLRLSLSSGRSVACYLGTSAPQSRAPLLALFAQPLEAAAVGVGEGSRARHPQHDEILVEEVLVEAVLVRVEVDVGEGATVGVLGVSYARNL